MTKVYGGIELGGTKIICAITNKDNEILNKIRIPTESPDITMPKIAKFFKEQQKEHEVLAIGIASFGPIDLNPESKTYGYITVPPKLAWQHFNILGYMQNAMGDKIKLVLDTDVNAAALAEGYWGNAKGLTDFIYITVGTGIGIGVVVNKKLVHGLMHPEGGHIYTPKHPDDDFTGVCPTHDNCLEGLASGPSLKERWNVDSALNLPEDHKAWDIEAFYLGHAIVNYICTLSPMRIIIGGGVLGQKHLLAKIHKVVQEKLNGYIQKDEIIKNIDQYIVTPGLGGNAGSLGAVALVKK